MKVFIVFRDGVYRHEILGAYADFESASDRARQGCDQEEDGYHIYVIGQMELGQSVEDLTEIGHWRRPVVKNMWPRKHGPSAYVAGK